MTTAQHKAVKDGCMGCDFVSHSGGDKESRHKHTHTHTRVLTHTQAPTHIDCLCMP